MLMKTYSKQHKPPVKILELGEGAFFGFENAVKGHKNRYSVLVESAVCEVMSISMEKLMINASEKVQAAVRKCISDRNVHLDQVSEKCHAGRAKAL